ncbi:hypothetical protein GCM10027416_30510 [Okibacterium endophyticum]
MQVGHQVSLERRRLAICPDDGDVVRGEDAPYEIGFSSCPLHSLDQNLDVAGDVGDGADLGRVRDVELDQLDIGPSFLDA